MGRRVRELVALEVGARTRSWRTMGQELLAGGAAAERAVAEEVGAGNRISVSYCRAADIVTRTRQAFAPLRRVDPEYNT